MKVNPAGQAILPRLMPYSAYSLEDFLADESFQDFAWGRDPEAVRFWQQWRADHPAQAADFEEAVAMLQQLAGAPLPLRAGLLAAELTKLRHYLHADDRPRARPALRSGRRTRRAPYWLALVAVLAVVGLLLTGRGRWPGQAPLALAPATYARYATRPGEQRRLTLPDGSRIVLNGSTELRLAAAWQPGQAREVWLTGDAYFDVRHTAPAQLKAVAAAPARVKFTVHAGPLDIAVLGTRFTVFSRAQRAEVVLSAGQVQLSLPRGPVKPVLMRPGELVTYNAATPDAPLTKRPVQAALYSAWTSGQLDFTDTPVADIIAALQDTYGLQITVRDPALLRQKLSGSLPGRDLDGLLTAFGKSLDVSVRRQGNRVWLY